MTMATPIFEKFVSGHVQIVPGNMLVIVKFEVSIFNRVETISI